MIKLINLHAVEILNVGELGKMMMMMMISIAVNPDLFSPNSQFSHSLIAALIVISLCEWVCLRGLLLIIIPSSVVRARMDRTD